MPTTEKPIQHDFTFKRGDSWPRFSFSMVNENSVAVTFSGGSILMQVKKNQKDATSLQVFTHLSGFPVTGDIATLTSDTNNLLVGVYVYDIQVTLASGLVKTLYEGKVNITQDTSR